MALTPCTTPPSPVATEVLEPLVARMSSRYGVSAADVRSHALEILAQFADARLQLFVPVLAEKQLRTRLRRRGPVQDAAGVARPAGAIAVAGERSPEHGQQLIDPRAPAMEA